MEGRFMTRKKLLFALPLLLLVGLSACASNGVQPGIQNRSGAQQSYPSNQSASNQSYVPNQGYQNASMSNGQGNGPVNGTTPLDPNDPANSNADPNSGPQNSGPQNSGPQTAYASPNGGRVVSINDVSLQGGGGGGRSGGGMGNGTMIGGLLGGAGGAIIGASSGRGLGGGLIGGLLGAVAGGIGGAIFDQHGGTGGGGGGGRGIEVTVQKDDGQNVTVAQKDVGDIQLGDRVQIVQGRNGVSQVVRDTQRNPD
jgi:hypothetical protein